MLFMDYCLWKGASFIDMYIYIHSYIYIFIYIYICPCYVHAYEIIHLITPPMLLNGCRFCEHHRSASRPGSHGGSVSGHGLLMLVDRCFLEYSGIWLLIPILIPIYIYICILFGSTWVCLNMWCTLSQHF